MIKTRGKQLRTSVSKSSTVVHTTHETKRDERHMFDVPTDQISQNWNHDQDIGEQLLRGISKLNREKGVLIRMFGVPMLGTDVVNILNAHKDAENPAPNLETSLAIVQELLKR
ncbi:MAG: hypothetical protein ACPGVN_09070, partial [Alphaproteobacteria bacterium]